MLLAEQGVASQTLKLSPGSQHPTPGGYRLEEFLKELPTVIKRSEPNLGSLLAGNVPLARRLKLRELQTSFVYTTVLAKKSKVFAAIASCACQNNTSQYIAADWCTKTNQRCHGICVYDVCAAAGPLSQLL